MNDNTAHNSINFGSLLKEELKRRGISQKDFADAFGLKPSNVSGIIAGKRKIPVNLMPVVSELISVDESTIINAQKNIIPDTKKTNSDSEEEIIAKNELDSFNAIVSIKALFKAMHQTFRSSIEKLEALKKEYDLTTPEDLASRLRLMSERCFRRSDKTGLDNLMICTWVVKAHALAKKNPLPVKYDHQQAPELVPELCKILHANRNNTPRQVQTLLNSFGIGYIELEKEPKASIEGYSFMLGETPYIVVTRRFDRIDNYAFNIMHELGHILLGHINESGRINVAVPFTDSMEGYPEQEEAANKFANEQLIPNKIWFLAPPVPLNPYVIQNRYTQWAKSKNLNPWIVLGRVSHETGMYRFTTDNTRKISKGKEGVSMAK